MPTKCPICSGWLQQNIVYNSGSPKVVQKCFFCKYDSGRVRYYQTDRTQVNETTGCTRNSQFSK